jgi:Cytochrome C oxidase, cbb3-type, subunit III
MKRSFFFASLFLTICWFGGEACKHQPQDIGIVIIPKDTVKPPVDRFDSTGWRCSPDTAYYADIQAILIANCAMSGCHDAITKAKGVIYGDFATTKSKGALTKIMREISGANASMPPAPRPILPAVQVALIQKWINQGALEKVCNPNYGSCDTTLVKFSDYVSPLIQSSCKGCHNPNSTNGGINLTTHAEIKASIQTGKFMGSIKHTTGFSAMPKGGAKMSDCQIKKIQRWINLGALDN